MSNNRKESGLMSMKGSVSMTSSLCHSRVGGNLDLDSVSGTEWQTKGSGMTKENNGMAKEESVLMTEEYEK